MLFTTWKVEEEEYKLRLNASACVKLEEDLNQNPISVLQSISEDNLPKLETLLRIIHASMTAFNHGIKLTDVYGIYDKWVDEGHGFADLVPIVLDIFKCSGFIPDQAEDNGKN